MDAALQTILFGKEPAAHRAARYGLVSAWNGADTTDAYGSNTLTAVNGPTTAAGPNGAAGQAWSFASASHQYESVNDNAGLSMGDIGMWMAGWAKATTLAPTVREIVVKGDDNAWSSLEYGLQYYSVPNRFRFGVSPGGAGPGAIVAADTLGAPSTGTWYFVFGYHDPTNNVIKISVNAGAFDSAAWSGGIQDGTGSFKIGSDANTRDWDGAIANVCVGKNPTVPIASIAPEIATFLYNNGIGRRYPW